RRRHTRWPRDWSSDVCSSDLATPGTGGGYIRFGVRDMTNSTNRTALQNILAGIAANTTDPAEKVAGMANKDEDAGFYEIYKYLRSEERRVGKECKCWRASGA